MKKKELKRLELKKQELENQALDALAEDSNFNVVDWLCAEDKLEYQRILYKLGDSDYDPDTKKVKTMERTTEEK